MPQLSPGQIASVVKQAGWPVQEIPLAVAIVLGESSGVTDRRGDIHLQTGTWGPSVGLFQIRSLNSQKGKGTTRDELANLDPLTNARHALEIRKSQGLAAWTVFNTRAYMQFMGKALIGVASPQSVVGMLPNLPNPLGDTLQGVGELREGIQTLTDGSLWLRAVMVIGGFWLMFLAVLMVFFGGSAGETTVKVGKAVAQAVVTKKVAK